MGHISYLILNICISPERKGEFRTNRIQDGTLKGMLSTHQRMAQRFFRDFELQLLRIQLNRKPGYSVADLVPYHFHNSTKKKIKSLNKIWCVSFT